MWISAQSPTDVFGIAATPGPMTHSVFHTRSKRIYKNTSKEREEGGREDGGRGGEEGTWRGEGFRAR